MVRSSPTVSVIMPVFNPEPEYLRLAVQSILAQSFRDLELIIVEDPADITARRILGDRLDRRVRIHANRQRTSLVEQRNTALRLARGQLIACLDSDDIAESNRIQEQVDFMRQYQDTAVLGSQLKVIDAHGALVGFRCYPRDHSHIAKAMRIYNPIAQPAVMFRPQPILEQNGYQPPPSGVNEDYDLWCRLAKAGYRFATHPEALTRYRIHTQGMKATHLRSMLRETIRIKRKYWRGEFGLQGSIRLAIEYMLLYAPESLVSRLFFSTQIRGRPCPD